MARSITNPSAKNTSARRRKAETNPAPEPESGGLENEIAELRRLLENAAAKVDAHTSLTKLLQVLRTFSIGAARLAAVLKAEQGLAKNASLNEAVERALAELAQELGTDDPPAGGQA